MNREKRESDGSFQFGFLSAEPMAAIPGLLQQKCLPAEQKHASALSVLSERVGGDIRFHCLLPYNTQIMRIEK